MQKKSKRILSMPGRSPDLPEMPAVVSEQLWVRPSSNLRQQPRHQEEGNITPSSAQRFLELADVALGLKKPTPNKKKAKALPPQTHHEKIIQHKRKVTSAASN